MITLISLFAAILAIATFIIDPAHDFTLKKKVALASFFIASTINVLSLIIGPTPGPKPDPGLTPEQRIERERLQIEHAFLGSWQEINSDVQCTFKPNNIFTSDHMMQYDEFRVIRNQGKWFLSLKKNDYTIKDYRITLPPYDGLFELVRYGEERKFKEI